MLLCYASASMDPLPDGLLLTKADQLYVQSAEWTILVVIDTPELDPDIMANINLVIQQSRSAAAKDIITALQNRSWIGRLRFLKSYLREAESLAQLATPRRDKRGLFDFFGQIGHTLFGLATDDSVEQCRRAIINTRRYQQGVVHQINELTTVLNRTYSTAMWNKHQITQVTEFISDSLIPKLNKVIEGLNATNNRLYRLERAFYFERVVATLEQVTLSYVRLRRAHARQKASLELGRLTEDILSLSQLREILLKATSTTTYPVEPIQWYYEHAHVYPVWGSGTLIYRVKLPLVDGRKYSRYNLATWPVPYMAKGYSIRIMIDHQDVGMNSVTGDIFHPIGCQGWKPMVCRTGPLYSAHRWGCPRTLIAGDFKRSKNCQVIIQKEGNLTQVTEISYGEYVVVTWGETFETRCEGLPGVRKEVAPGTYLVTVSPNCTVMGRDVTLTGLIERLGHVSVKAMRVLVSNILNITDIVPAEQAISLLGKPHFDQRAPSAQIDLAPIAKPPDAFTWPYHGTRISFGLVLTLTAFGVMLAFAICLCQYRRRQILEKMFGRKVPRDKTDPESESLHTVDHEFVVLRAAEAPLNNDSAPVRPVSTQAEVPTGKAEPLAEQRTISSSGVFQFEAKQSPSPKRT